MLPLLQANMLNPLLWSGLGTVINPHDQMQNLYQLRIFYKKDVTHWPDKLWPNDPFRFQAWYACNHAVSHDTLSIKVHSYMPWSCARNSCSHPNNAFRHSTYPDMNKYDEMCKLELCLHISYLFYASTVVYNTSQQQAKSFVQQTHFSSITKVIHLKLVSLWELTFSTIAEINFTVKQHSSLTVSRTQSCTDPVCPWGFNTNLMSSTHLQ